MVNGTYVHMKVDNYNGVNVIIYQEKIGDIFCQRSIFPRAKITRVCWCKNREFFHVDLLPLLSTQLENKC